MCEYAVIYIYVFLTFCLKMQKLVKAAREGTKDGLEKTKAAVKKGRCYIKTKSFCNGTHSGTPP